MRNFKGREMNKLFLGGMPTDADVRLICAALPNLKEGDDVTHEQIEQAINIGRNESRYRTVVNAWRKSLLKNDNLEVVAVPSVGYRCLTPPERVKHNLNGFQVGSRKQGRHVRRSSLIPTQTLTKADQAKLDHLQKIGASLS